MTKKYTPTIEEVRHGWQTFSAWKRSPSCGFGQSAEEFDLLIAQVKAEALEDFADRIYPGPTADTIISAARAKALEYRKEATR